MITRSGKFIVIDGTDGSGKTTQLNLLATKLKDEGYGVAIADFPQYNTKSAGMVEEYLSGKYGGAGEVDPYQASIFYAVDRYDASFKIKEWLKEGKIVLANRYVSSNLGHQGGKFDNPLERKIFFNWLYDLEYRLFSVPKPDLSLILHVEADIAQQLAAKRQREDWTGKTKDIHENDLNHLKRAEQVYLEIARTFPDFKLIKCTNQGKILPPEEINYLIWIYIKRIINIGEPAKTKGLQAISDIITKNHRLSEKFPELSAQSYRAPENEDIKIKKLNDWLNPASETEAPIEISLKAEEKTEKTEVKAHKRSCKIRVQKIHPSAQLPSKEHHRNAGFDLYSHDYYSIPPYQQALISTGLKIKIPHGHVGLIWDKSGLANFGFKVMGGVIDANYREEIRVIFKNLSEDIYHIVPGQKIAQLLVQPIADPEMSEDL
ncbi:MAG: hypothetical protein WC441_03205 [Patescibacteria group bacterium]